MLQLPYVIRFFICTGGALSGSCAVHVLSFLACPRPARHHVAALLLACLQHFIFTSESVNEGHPDKVSLYFCWGCIYGMLFLAKTVHRH